MDAVLEMLRRIALNDEGEVQKSMCFRSEMPESGDLDPKTRALVRLGALLALDAAPVSYQWAVEDVQACGFTTEEVVSTLVAVAPVIGLARLVSTTPKLAMAIGYDIDEALESLE